jgi:hypothetical protein
MFSALGHALTKRGAVFNVFNVKFPSKTEPKYCVLMEDYSPGANGIMVVFTTHRIEFEYQKTSVKVIDGKINGITGDTLIQCQNYWEFPAEVFCNPNKSKYLDQLTKDVMEQVNEALTYVRDIDEATLIRMLE